MLNLIIFGPPGAGKGTQAKLIAKEYGLTHLSSGNFLREEVVSNSELGQKIKKYQDEGILVPNELLTNLLKNIIKKKFNAQGFIFDGYPRSIQQTHILADILKENNLQLTGAINLKIGEEEALKRLLLRGKTSGRSDDNEKVIKNRFRVYHQETGPILEYYQEQKKLINIDGEKTIKQVATNIKEEIKKL